MDFVVKSLNFDEEPASDEMLANIRKDLRQQVFHAMNKIMLFYNRPYSKLTLNISQLYKSSETPGVGVPLSSLLYWGYWSGGLCQGKLRCQGSYIFFPTGLNDRTPPPVVALGIIGQVASRLPVGN